MEETRMANKSVVRLDRVNAVYYGGNTYSVRADVELENGFVGKLGDIEANNPDVNKLVKPAAGDSLVLIANPAMVYDNGRMGSGKEIHYSMEANEVVRAYELQKHDVIGISQEGINGQSVVGEYLVAGAGYKLVPSATLPATGFAAKVVRFDSVGGAMSINVTQTPTVYTVMEIVQN